MKKLLLLAIVFSLFSFAASAQFASLDSTFGVNALAYDSFPGGPTLSSIKVLSNDKIVAVGFNNASATNKFVLARYQANGALDSTFGTNGWLQDSVASVSGLAAVTVLLQYDSLIVVTGSYYTTTNSRDTGYLWACRFRPNGQVDNTFGTGGMVKISLRAPGTGNGSNNYYPGTGALQPDNKILVGGTVQEDAYGNCGFVLVRFTANGVADNTFGTGGKVVTAVSAPFSGYLYTEGDYLTSIVVEPSGKIIAGGYNFNTANTSGYTAGDFKSEIECYKSNGKVDSSFGVNGRFMLTDYLSGRLTSLGLLSNGTVAAVGYSNSPGDWGHLFYVDTTGNMPAYAHDYTGYNSQLWDFFITEYHTCYIAPNNKVLAAGYTTSGYIGGTFTGAYDDINRFQPNGFVDTFFINYHTASGSHIGNGWVLSNFAASGVNALGMQSTGKIIAAGSPFFTLTRIFPGLDTMDCSDFSATVVARSYLCTSNPADTFRASSYNLGANPSYQWYKNGIAVGSNSATYIPASLSSGDSVWVSLTVGTSCVGPQTMKSNVIHISISPPPVVTIMDTLPYCQYYTFHGLSLNTTGIYRDTFPAINGCDSITILNLTMSPRFNDTIQATICLGDSFVFRGASLKRTGFFTFAFYSGNSCDSFYFVNLKVNGTIDTISRTICTGSSYNFYGHILTTAGTYRDTLTSVVTGCDSIKTIILSFSNTLSGPIIQQNLCSGSVYNFYGRLLTVGGYYYDTLTAVGGCDSIIWLILNISSTINTYQNQTICAGSSYTFGGRVLRTAGAYYDTLRAVGGCDSIVTLSMTVTSPLTGTAIGSICAGNVYNFGGRQLTSAGTYRDTMTTASGCDSIVTLTLTVTPARTTAISHSMCAGSGYSFGGHSLTAAGTYRDTLITGTGCDSIVTLTLTLTSPSVTAISHNMCAGSTYSFGGRSLTIAGTYRDTLITGSGCDSIVTLTLSVTSVSNTPLTHTMCQGSSYVFGGHTLISSGIYRDTLTAASGCDSILTLTLTVNNITNTALSRGICTGSSYVFGGQTLSSSGTYRDTLTASTGCDSIVTLTLTVSSVINTSVSHTICAGGSYSFGGHTLTAAGTYRDTVMSSGGCDSVVTLSLAVASTTQTHISDTVGRGGSVTVGTHTYTQSGTYIDTLTASTGCDSIVTLELDILTGIGDISSSETMHLYPNPNKGTFTLQTSNGTGTAYTITDMLGKVVMQGTIRSDHEVIGMQEATDGVYTLMVKGAPPLRFVVVK